MSLYRRTCSVFIVLISSIVLISLRRADAFQNISSGGIQGKVVLDNDGSAVSGVTLTLVQISPTPNTSVTNLPNSGAVTTTPITGSATGPVTTVTTAPAQDGSFTVTGLAIGQYAVCVKDPIARVIDPCLWTDSRTTANVSAAALSSGLVVRVKKASSVGLRVNDTAQALAQRSTEPSPPHVLVGAFDSRGGFHAALVVQKDSTGISYQISIPVDSPIRISVYSAQVKLETSSTVSLPAQGYSMTFVQPSSQAQTNSFTFNAVGRN